MSDLPRGWALAQIPNLVGSRGVFVDGDWVESKDQDPNGSVRLIQLADVGDGIYVDKSKRFLTERKADQLRCTFLEPGDVLVARMPDPLGRACIFPGDKRRAVTVVDVCVIRACDDAFDHGWLMYFINAPDFRSGIHSLQSGSTRKRISRGNLSSLRLPVPPRAEQTRIVAKLEELLSGLDAGVAELRTAQKKLAQYRQSLLKAAIEGALTADWRAARRASEVVPLDPVGIREASPRYTARADSPAPETETGAELLARILTERRTRWEAKQLAKFKEQSKAPPTNWRSKYQEPVAPDPRNLPALPEWWAWATVDQLSLHQRYGSSAKTSADLQGVPVLRMGNIQNSKLDLTELKYLPAGHHEFPDLYLQDGDMLFNRTNSPELVGKTAVYRSQLAPCSYASYLIAVRFSNLFVPEVASAYINSVHGRNWIRSVVVQQVGQANVNGSKLAALAVPLPPLAEQHAIVEQLQTALAACDAQAQSIDKSLAQSAAQRQNILRAAFAGQLVPQDPNDEPAAKLLERIRAERTEGSVVGKPKRTRRAVSGAA